MTERRWQTFVEIDVSICSLTCFTAPCTAIQGTAEEVAAGTATGTQACFNTIGSCQDRANYSETFVTLRFCKDTGYQAESGIEALPFLIDADLTPSVISVGENLGRRASLSCAFRDQPHSDTGEGFDKYRSTRINDPFKQGTFWGKFGPRHPNLRGKRQRLIQGFVGQTLDEMWTQHFLLDSADGPDLSGAFKTIAKDPLKSLDGDRAKAPAVSAGYLVADITDDTNISAQLSPSGIGNDDDYDAAGYLNINGEIVSFYRDPDAGNDSDAKLLLHFDGSDGSTSFADSSASARTATPAGNAQLDTAKQRFGTASLLLDGTGDYVTFTDSADWTFGTEATLDAQVWFNALPTLSTICSHATDANNQYRWTVSSTGVIAFTVLSASSTIISLSSAAGVISTGQWYHLELVKNGNSYAIYVDGVAVATTTDSDAIPGFTSTFKIGADGGSTNTLNGWIDEFRVSAVARHTADFDPPEAPYNTSSDLLTLTGRGLRSTEAASHEAGDRVQTCLVYTAQDPAAIISDLMTTYGGVDSDYIPLADWLTETAAYNGQVYTGFLPEPEAVKTLVGELIQQAALKMWWDEIAELVRLQVLRAVSTSAQTFDETMIKKGSLSVEAQPDKRKSEIWTYFGQTNPVDGLDLSNLPGVAVLVDTDSESDYGSSAIDEIASRWIPTGGRVIAERLNQLRLGRYLSPPRSIQFQIPVGADTVLPVMGGGYKLSHPTLQDVDGSRIELPFTVTSLKLKNGVCAVYGEEFNWTDLAPDPANRVIALDYNTYNINWRTLHDNLFGAPYAGGTVTLQIASNARIGSTSTSEPALQTGTWPSVAFTATRTSGNATLTSIADTSAFVVGQAVTGTGIQNDSRVVSKTSNTVTLDKTASASGTSSLTLWTTILKLVVEGQVIGSGGGGGGGAYGDNVPGYSGYPGGTGLRLTAPVDLSGAGKIDGGGGGGGGGGGDQNFWGSHDNGGGGGGGAGDVAGNGGYSIAAGPGSAGSLDAGGAGGWGTHEFSGGGGGAPGSAGGGGGGNSYAPGGAGGAAGKSVDGDNYLKDSAFTGAYRGPKAA